MPQLIVIISSVVLTALLIFLVSCKKVNINLLKFRTREDSDSTFYFLAKIIAFVLFVLLIIRSSLPEVFEQIVNKDRLFSPNTIVSMVILRTMTAGAIFLLLVSPWFNYRPFQNGVAVLGTLTYIFDIVFFKQNIMCMLGLLPRGAVPMTPRVILFMIEIIFGLSGSLLYLFKRVMDKDYSNLAKQILLSILFFVLFGILTMNPWTFENLLDEESLWGSPRGFNKTQISCLIVMVLITITTSIIFRNVKDKGYLHCFLACCALVCLIDYITPMKYLDMNDLSPSKLPLHICNTGVFLMFVSFTIKSKPIFYFNYLVNIVGALFALLLPDYGEEVRLLAERGLHFWVNHVMLFILPTTAIAGGFYERPKVKFVMYSMFVFTAYFLLVGFLDAIWQDRVNFFFLNGDSIVEKFMWAPHLKDDFIITFTIGNLNFRIFWLYWLLTYVIYLGFILVAWFVFASLYQVSDGYADLITKTKEKVQAQKILKFEMGDRSISEPLHPENVGKIIINHFSKIYSGETKKAVDDLSITIEPGTVYGLLGHNGAGKSTTIKSLVGIQTITEGNIEINGFDLEQQPVEAKMNIGYVSDNHTVYEHLTGREYINYVADLNLVNKEERDERIEKYVKMFNLEDAIDREIKGYSHGMKQKIVVIASLIHEPKVWVLDEPLTGLDPTSSFQIKNIMKQYAEKGNIVCFSSHVIEVVEKICDRIGIINHGKLIGEWDIKNLHKEGTSLQELYTKYVSYKKDGDVNAKSSL